MNTNMRSCIGSRQWRPMLGSGLTFIAALRLALPAFAQTSVTIESVKPNKILYLFNEQATANITLKNGGTSEQKGRLAVREAWDLTESREIMSAPVTLQPQETKTVKAEWNTGSIMYGRSLTAAFVQGSKVVAVKSEFYQVADPKEWFRCFMINGGGKETSEASKTNPFATYHNYDNHFCYALSAFSNLAPQEDEWVSGQARYYIRKKELLANIQARRELGVRSGGYTIGATGGPAGYEFARQHPDWMLRDKKGAFLTYAGPVSPTDVAKKTNEHLQGWYALVPDLGNPEVVRFAGEEVVRAFEMFDWDAMFFDGLYGVHLEGNTALGAFTWDGKPVTREEGTDKLSAQCVGAVRDIIRASCPNVALWYNGSTPRAPLLEARIVSLQDTNVGTLHEIQGAQMANKNFYGHHWRSLYEIYMNERNALLKAKGIDDPVLASGYTYNLDPRNMMTKEEYEASRDTWTTANHLGALMLTARIHPCVLASDGFRPTTQFMTRYSALLWARDVKWVKEPWKIINVESNREVWWEEGVYTREGRGRRDTILNIINSPDGEAFDLKVAKDPDPAKNVEVEFTTTADPRKVRIWALQPYGYGSKAKESTAVELKPERDAKQLIVELPPFTYYTMVVLREETGGKTR